ncbi:MAG: molybdopterin-guanine dinucleotide biosynthesis protein B [Desulfobulbaceae bacterium]|nr:molybdopterin-guanine dinucleotide biosynthesis protein B [Desulfobulbaceae bacterium]
MPPIISIIGKANSGKTTLLEKLIPVLRGRQIRVGTIKHHVHEFNMDKPGKDTWRHKQAGANVVALSSPTGLGIIRETDHDTPLDEIVQRYFDDVDLVITEGYKSGPAPKIEIFRLAAHDEPLANRDHTWLTIVSDKAMACDLPLFTLDDTAGLADFLINTFSL